MSKTHRYRSCLFQLASLVLITAGSNLVHASISINELLASNDSVLSDGSGEFDDWVELYNSGISDVDLAGYYISDDLGDLLQYQIPDGFPSLTTVPAGGFLILWADNDSEQGANHLSFALSAGGEELVLTAPDGETVVDEIGFEDQETDISFGRFPDGSGDFQLFNSPTPGMSNESGFVDQVADMEFSVDRGFFEQAFDLEISTSTPDALIHYTIDGSVPTQSSFLYSEPLNISGTTTIRARAFRENYLPTNTDTQTYIFVSDVIVQSPNGEAPGSTWPAPNYDPQVSQIMDYGMDPEIVNDPAYSELIDDALLAIPSISMVTDSDNLFDPATGIYAVPFATGRGWERPTSIELIYPDGTDGFQIDCGMRIRGSSSSNTNNPKHAFRFFFRSEYGQSTLKYPLFADEGVDEFRKVDLRTSKNYGWARALDNRFSGSMNREVLWRDTQKAMGQPYTRSRYYHLYINGQYWGLFQTQERSEAHYAESYLGGDNDDFDVIKSNGGGPSTTGPTDGNADAWTRLWQACVNGFSSDETYYSIQGFNMEGEPDENHERLVDLENLIDYMLVVFVLGCIDGPLGRWSNDTLVNNYWAIYNRENPDGFKHFVHDFETSMVSLNDNRIGPFGTGELYPNMSAQYIHERMAEHPEYRMQFADRVQKHLLNDGVLTSQAIIDRFNERASEIEVAIIAESARWGDALTHPPSTRDETWVRAVNELVNGYFPRRPGIVLSQLRNAGLFPLIDAPGFLVSGSQQHGGIVPKDTNLFFMPFVGSGSIYYTLNGNDVRTPFESESFVPVEFIPESAPKRIIVPEGPISDGWYFENDFDDSTWSQATGIIGYEAASGYEEFIDTDILSTMYEQNASCLIRIPFDVSQEDVSVIESLRLGIRYDDGYIAYLNGEEIHRENFDGTPTWNSQASGGRPDSITPETLNIPAQGFLNTGENLLAIHGLNAVPISSDFMIGVSLQGIPQTVEGGGELTADAILYSSPIVISETVQIHARLLKDGIWSAMTEATFSVEEPSENIRVSELMYDPATNGDAEFLELHNNGPEPVTLTGFQFVDGIDLTFPDSSLEPGEHGVIVADLTAFQSVYGMDIPVLASYSGKFNNDGEQVTLQDAFGNEVFDFTYGSERTWPLAADGIGHSLVPNETNFDPRELSYPFNWSAGSLIGGTPGEAEPEVERLVINEIAAHTDSDTPGRESNDMIEIFNPNPFSVDLDHWYLSDDADQLDKFALPAESIGAGEVRLFSEENDFNNPLNSGFSLSKLGEELFLSFLPPGGPDRISDAMEFEASENGSTLSRLPDGAPWLANSLLSLGSSNTNRIYDVVISELMYNPMGSKSEYIEIWNPTDAPVLLENSAGTWFIGGGIEFSFPDSITIFSGEHLVVIPFDPTDSALLSAFESDYGSMENVRLFGPYSGSLSNGGELISLVRYEPPGPAEPLSDIIVDEVYYYDTTPFPESADGSGLSLHRFDILESGNNPGIWNASEPSPGVQSLFSTSDMWFMTGSP